MIEALTYRRGGHKRDDPATYRPREEVDAWLEQDPIPLFRARLAKLPSFPEAKLAAIEAGVQASLVEAIDFAQASPFPPKSMALEHVYA